MRNHTKIRQKLNAAGKKGLCETKEVLIKSGVRVSQEEWELHEKVFQLHNYSVPALTDVHCGRDALKELSERLSTSKK